MRVDAGDLRHLRRHERHCGDIRREAGEHGRGRRPLQRDERAVVGARKRHARGKMRRDMRIVRLLHRGVDDEHQAPVIGRVPRAADHEIVEDAAIRVEKLRIALLAGLEVLDIGGDEGLERRRRRRMVGPDEESLAHMRDVEEPGMLPRPVVFREDAGRVLHRHIVAREGHHAGARRDMLRMKRGLQKRLIRGGRLGHGPSKSRAFARALRPTSRPLCLEDLRDFPSPAINRQGLRPSVGRVSTFTVATLPLSRVPAPSRSFGLSVSGAVAPSAPGSREPGLSRGDQRLRPS